MQSSRSISSSANAGIRRAANRRKAATDVRRACSPLEPIHRFPQSRHQLQDLAATFLRSIFVIADIADTMGFVVRCVSCRVAARASTLAASVRPVSRPEVLDRLSRFSASQGCVTLLLYTAETGCPTQPLKLLFILSGLAHSYPSCLGLRVPMPRGCALDVPVIARHGHGTPNYILSDNVSRSFTPPSPQVIRRSVPPEP
jgi:hypothetical protein